MKRWYKWRRLYQILPYISRARAGKMLQAKRVKVAGLLREAKKVELEALEGLKKALDDL